MRGQWDTLTLAAANDIFIYFFNFKNVIAFLISFLSDGYNEKAEQNETNRPPRSIDNWRGLAGKLGRVREATKPYMIDLDSEKQSRD